VAEAAGPEASGGRPLVIGVGNPDCGDDGIGPAVVERLRRRRDDVDAVIVAGDLTVLPVLWRDRDDVVVVDACRTGRPPGSIVTVEAEDLDGDHALSSHGVGVGFAVALGGRLGWLPRRLRIVGIEAEDLVPGPLGAGLGSRVEAIADEVSATLATHSGRSSLAR
jgi:hydrogenase maturation protease